MSFDCSRFTFNAWNDFLGVVMQQGRVQLDADWNEFVAQMIRRIQTGTLDILDETVVPRGTPDGFHIEFRDGKLTIGVGRMYVDGILVENHGNREGKRKWDAQLAEQIGSEAIDYMKQPYYPLSPAEAPSEGRYLVYLDVWQREVTYLQYPDLVEKAVGVDTTARLQTVWQVKLLDAFETAGCSSADTEMGEKWEEVLRPSAARLTTSTGNVSTDKPDPCLIPPTGGYKGLENQLYRVEIHDGGTAGTASFKWSRDNGTVHSLVSQINSADRLVVDSVGRDQRLRFSNGNWVEITNDVLELHGKPGIMRQIKSVDDATRTITLTQNLPPDGLPTGGLNGDPDKVLRALHTRIRRWDQSDQIKRADGTLFYDLHAPDNITRAPGVIPIPPEGTELLLESGILVKFDLEGSGGSFHVGDHWSFAARTADAKINDELKFAPPLGTHHHYARLAVMNFPGCARDCRVFWPPKPVAGNGCVCDVCVTAEGHAAGADTIQHAIDSLHDSGGVICLAAGIYRLKDIPLNINGINSLIIRGKGWRTVLVPDEVNSAIQIADSQNITLENFAVAGAVGENISVLEGPDGGVINVLDEGKGLITAYNTVGLKLDRLNLLALPPSEAGKGVAVDLNGHALGMSVQQCAIVADIGIRGGKDMENLLLTANLSLCDNLLVCNYFGLKLDKWSFHYGATEFTRNLVLAAKFSAVMALGGALPGSSLRIDANSLHVPGDGIIAGTDGLRITDNEINANKIKGIRGRGNGIVLVPGLDPTGIDHVWIMGNRLTELSGNGIEVRAPLGSAIIKQNIVERTRGGIVFVQAGSSDHLVIENNQLLNIDAVEYTPPAASVVGIQVLDARNVNIVGNILSNFAQKASHANDRVAIRVAASDDICISGNHLSELGPVRGPGYVVGIEIQPPYKHATVSENIFSQPAASATTGNDTITWQAIRIAPPTETGTRTAFFSAADAIAVFANQKIYFLTRTRLRALSQTLAEALLIRANRGTARLTKTELVIAQSSVHYQSPVHYYTLKHCIFSDNLFNSTIVSDGATMVKLEALTTIASNNQLHWGNDNEDSGFAEVLNIISLTSRSQDKYTVVGNVTTKPIRIITNIRHEGIRSVELKVPWKALNVVY